MHRSFKHLRIRTKFFLSYFSIVIVILSVSSFLTYSLVRKSMDVNLSTNMDLALDSVQGMVVSMANLSVRNHLKSLVEKQIAVLTLHHDNFQRGYVTEKESKNRAFKDLLSESIGTSGYIYCIDSKGIVKVHPESDLVGADLSRVNFIKKQMQSKKGYLEYEWKNPREDHPRLKALYMEWFEPWDLIVSASSYKDEFSDLVDPKDISKAVSSFKLGVSGYVFGLDKNGKINISPDFTSNQDLDQSLMKSVPTKKIISAPTCFTVIEKKDRRIIHAHRQIPTLGWTLVSVAYEDEFYSAALEVKKVFFFMGIFLFFTILGLNLWLSNSLNRPMQQIIAAFEKGISGDFSIRINNAKSYEFNIIARYFNKFMETFEAYTIEIIKKNHYKNLLLLSDSVFQNSVEGITVSNAKGIIERVNPAFEAITGYSAKEAIGQNPRILKSDRHPQEFYEAMWSDLRKKGQWSGEIWNRRKNGEAYPEWLSINAIIDSKGNISNYVAVFHDMTEIKQTQEQLKFNIYHDALTGLPNRLLFEDRLERSIDEAQKKNYVLAVLCLDIDNFKHINESLGHHLGDLVLKEIGNRVSDFFTDKTTVSRFGGDQFNIILGNISTHQDAVVCAANLMGLFKKPFMVDEKKIYVNISIGISLFPTDGNTTSVLIKNAEIAMHKTKALGKNSYSLFESGMNQKIAERLQLEADLRQGLKKNEFQVFYQPKVDASTEKISGMEALIRWNNGKKGLISPGDFIPLAEETGMIEPIGTWVLKEACIQTRAWHNMGYNHLKIAVNLSAAQFRNKNLITTIKNILDESGLNPIFLNLEITESLVMHDVKMAIDAMKRISDLGVSFSLDDFGTGYSSLSYLKRFPVSILKVDQSFVREIPNSKDDMAIARTIISMAKSLNMKTVAEGVETLEQLKFMQDNGCDEIQGYYFSPPVPANQFQDLLKKTGTDLKSVPSQSSQ